MKKKIAKKVSSLTATVLMVIMSRCQASAAVDVAGGLERATSTLKNQIKAVAVIVFGLMALVALILGLVKLGSGLIENHRNSNVPRDVKTACFAFAAAVLCAAFSTTAFFGWFGL